MTLCKPVFDKVPEHLERDLGLFLPIHLHRVDMLQLQHNCFMELQILLFPRTFHLVGDTGLR